MDFILDPKFQTLLVIVLALIAFIAEWLPVDITALLVTSVLMILGLVTPDEGIAGFGNSATITVLMMFILSAGVVKTGVTQSLRNWLLRWGGARPRRQIFVLGLLIGPITAFVNNTAVVAIFMPIIESWCQKSRISPSKLLIPLSYLTILGGTITVIGTTTNILASGLSKDLGYGEFSLFQFSKLGLTVFAIGLMYLTFVAPRLIPSRRSISADLETFNVREYVSEVVIAPRSALINQTLRQSGLQRQFDLDVLEIIRNGNHFPQPLSDKILRAGDVLLVRSSTEELLNIRDQAGLDLLPQVKFAEESNQESLEHELSSGEEEISEVLILSNSRLVGTTLKEIRFRQRYNATVLAIRRGEEVVRDRLGQVPLRFGDLLLVQGPRDSLKGMQTTRELLVLEPRDAENLRVSKAGLAIGIVAGVIVIAALKILPIMVAALLGVISMVVTKCLKPGELYGAVRWDVIFLLAGLIPLGTAMRNSGATDWLANQVVSVGGHFSGYWKLWFFYLVTAILTELLSNNATVLLMLPIAAKVAEILSLSPLSFMITVTFAASNSYVTPIGYQTNTMIYGPGGYKFLDFMRVGLPMTITFTFLTPLLVIWIFGITLAA
ncbi:SLC13 family permease [Lyngbya confervoides]|uniref:SLC13 family permease n=1 Tax=Lyngbya confervoides BDU141951 TaxID=1574623 RepID=A0ABD4T2P2_9CYAN|nr:SLC13 family permease [Lyngbya confervoides]MCM1982763.1 SLC13 family permease [Lyngbya confervoides BDU141951]